MPQLHAVVHGRVQGVNFRHYTRIEAEKRSLTGWVSNRSDGTVETVAVGPREALESFAKWLHRGSPTARVQKVDMEWSEAESKFNTFEIQHDSE